MRKRPPVVSVPVLAIAHIASSQSNPLTQAEIALVADFRNMHPENQDFIFRLSQSFATDKIAEKLQVRKHLRLVPSQGVNHV